MWALCNINVKTSGYISWMGFLLLFHVNLHFVKKHLGDFFTAPEALWIQRGQGWSGGRLPQGQGHSLRIWGRVPEKWWP